MISASCSRAMRARRARQVERATQREREEVRRLNRVEFVAERRRGREGREDFVAALREAAREVCEVTLAAAECARRTDLEDSQRAFKRAACLLPASLRFFRSEEHT